MRFLETEETLVWIDATRKRPDDEVTVLIFAPNASEPVWPGYSDSDDSGSLWFWADGSQIDETVVAWAEIPAGPTEEEQRAPQSQTAKRKRGGQ